MCDPFDESWLSLNLESVERGAPQSFPVFERAEAIVWTAIGLGGILLAIPTLEWRRRRASARAYPSATTPASA